MPEREDPPPRNEMNPFRAPNPGDWDPVSAEEVAEDFEASGLPYRILIDENEPIRQGAQAAVYVAVDTRTGQRVAVKMLRPYASEDGEREANQDTDYLRRLRKEINGLQRLNHLNVVKILDPGGRTKDGYDYFVMEWLEGQTLAEWLADVGRKPPKRIVEIMAGICAGVQHAHEQGLVHRDLKASNVFLCRDGRVVVLDFGVAREMTAEQSTRTRLHGAPGTKGHIAPEVEDGEPATAVSDVFALGVIFLHMWTGKVPQVGHQWPRHFGAAQFDEAAENALAPDPRDRYHSAAEFIRVIQLANKNKKGDKVMTPTIEEKDMATPVSFAENIAQHRVFLAAFAGDDLPTSPNIKPHPGEVWRVSNEWDASHPGIEGQEVYPPSLVAWSPKGDFLSTVPPGYGIRTWRPNGSPLGADVAPSAYRLQQRIFTSQSGSYSLVLKQMTSYQYQHYHVYDQHAQLICSGPGHDLWGWCNGQLSDSGLNRNQGFNPWRPGTEREIAFVHELTSLKIVDLKALPTSPPKLLTWWESLFSTGADRESSAKVSMHAAPPVHWMNFNSLGKRSCTIFRFHFHPSGEYIAVNVGDWDDKHFRQVHIVHIKSAQIVASISATAEGLGWSPNGRFLLFKKWFDPKDASKSSVLAWDSTIFEVLSDGVNEILGQSWALQALMSARDSPDSSNRPSMRALSADGRRMLTNGGRKVTGVKRDGSSIKAGDELAEISQQEFAHAAWHPTDPHCFVTVGGEGSEKFPDMHTIREHRMPHSRLLRVWRLH